MRLCVCLLLGLVISAAVVVAQEDDDDFNDEAPVTGGADDMSTISTGDEDTDVDDEQPKTVGLLYSWLGYLLLRLLFIYFVVTYFPCSCFQITIVLKLHMHTRPDTAATYNTRVMIFVCMYVYK